MPKTLRFKDWDCHIQISNYQVGGRICLRLVAANSDGGYFRAGDPIAVATVNVPDRPIPEDCIIIKNYAENLGMLDCLVKAGIIGRPVTTFPMNFVTALVCPFNKTVCDDYKV